MAANKFYVYGPRVRRGPIEYVGEIFDPTKKEQAHSIEEAYSIGTKYGHLLIIGRHQSSGYYGTKRELLLNIKDIVSISNKDVIPQNYNNDDDEE